MRRPRLLLAATAALLAAAPLAAQSGARPTVTLPGYRGLVFLDTVGVVREFTAPAAAVTKALEWAFTELGINVQADEARGLVGNLQIQTQRRFARTPMSQLLDCGFRDRGPNADFYRIHLALMGIVAAKGEKSTSLRIAFAAGAQDFSGPLGDPIACGSTGKLEERILGFVAKQLGQEP